jgi:hypothetical protein
VAHHEHSGVLGEEGDGVDDVVHGIVDHGGDGGRQEAEGGFRSTSVERHGTSGLGEGAGVR